MIDHPSPGEKEKLVQVFESTGLFNAEEIKLVGQLLDIYFGNNEWGYIWIAYREAPATTPLGLICYGASALAEDVYDLYWMAVDSTHQNKKIGTALLQYVETDLKKRNARQLYIETSDTPTYGPTRTFYERRGYQAAAHLTDYYHVGDGKVIYRKVFRER